jgi:hypothetical protein
MTDRERPSKERLQGAERRPVGYFSVAEPERPQLPTRNNPVLPRSRHRNPVVEASGALYVVHGHINRTGA